MEFWAESYVWSCELEYQGSAGRYGPAERYGPAGWYVQLDAMSELDDMFELGIMKLSWKTQAGLELNRFVGSLNYYFPNCLHNW